MFSSGLGQVCVVLGLLGVWLILLQQIEKGAQLQSRYVGPASCQFHVLKELEEGASLGRKTGSEGAILDGAMQMLEMAEEGQEHLGIITVGRGDSADLLKKGLDRCLQCGDFRRESWRDT